jgi:hypothetical protein
MSDPFRIEITSGGDAGDWASAMENLQQEASVPSAPVGPVKPIATGASSTPVQAGSPPSGLPNAAEVDATPTTDRPLSKYEELIRTPSMKMERADLGVMTEFSQIIALVSNAARAADAVEKKHPGQVPERLIRLWRDNLRETSTVMLRELHAMRNGRQQKKYDKRCVCVECHSVFMVPLPGDGVCDACRAAKAPRTGPY